MTTPAPRKANRGSFRKGPDPRRHVFSRAERKRGYRAAHANTFKEPWKHAWFLRMIRSYYRANR